MLVRLLSSILLIVFLAAPGAADAQTYVHSASDAARLEQSDFWLVTLGDSFASGEGNPVNVAGVGVPINAWKWLDDEKCHRSKHAWPYQVAEYYENSDEYTRDVFHSFLACSGASVRTGVLNDYMPNWIAVSGSPVTAQLDQLQQQINRAGRTPDVVLLSAGGNDIGFGDIVRDCLWGGCPGGLANEDEVEDRLSALNGRYDAVARRLSDMGVAAGSVYQFQYPSPLWGKKRKIWLAWGPEKVLAGCWKLSGKNAWRWAQNEVVESLQSAAEAAVSRNGWTLIDGHLNDFVKHSYCPRNGLPGADSWWVGILSTVVRQWGVGAFHPNRRGHDRIAEVARTAIEGDVPTGWVLTEPDMNDDCISHNPSRVRVHREGSRWLMTDGDSRMMTFPNQAEARQALRVIQHYRITQQCFVGRPDPSLTYLLVGGRAPQGAVPSEDCIRFNAGNLTLRRAGNRWLMTDGNSRMMTFPNQAEARKSLEVIRAHGFTRTCYVGRPGPSFAYLRK